MKSRVPSDFDHPQEPRSTLDTKVPHRGPGTKRAKLHEKQHSPIPEYEPPWSHVLQDLVATRNIDERLDEYDEATIVAE
jgi:hypothetical protein